MHSSDHSAALPEPAAGMAPAAGVRARVWVAARHLFARAEAQVHCWLWLVRDDGRVHALRMDAAVAGCDHVLDRVLRLLDDGQTFGKDELLGLMLPLPHAPVVPVPRWSVSWGHPLQRAIRQFASVLDDDVLAALGQLETPGPFFGTVANYNRLALLPQPTRRHRLQALAEFPPLVAPLLLDVLVRPDLRGIDEDAPARAARYAADADATVLQAMDRGRDLIGALAHEHRIDRALVRAPLLREPWAGGGLAPEQLRLLAAIRPPARPRQRAQAEVRLGVLGKLPVQARSDADIARLATAFAHGWTRTWHALEGRYPSLATNLRDTRDFLRAALEEAGAADERLPLDLFTLALAWVARRGIASLLDASARWHAQPLLPIPMPMGANEAMELPRLFGEFATDGNRAIELTTEHALIAEGATMRHCVGSYWRQCVATPTRIVHVAMADGRAATAQFQWNGQTGDPRFHLGQLSGPMNTACAADVHAFVQGLQQHINAPARQQPRRDAVSAAAVARTLTAPTTTHRRLLDRRSRSELRQVLACALKQSDWIAPARERYRGPIAGFAHAEGPCLLDRIGDGDTLTLHREPANPNDRLAVRIDWNGHKLGYVPRAHNTAIAADLDAGIPLRARIVSVRRDGDAWVPVQCGISREADGA
ncbi:MAG: PcfJ domain-containing protein [Proteobacteria bacterium]|nr:PcfJ domain-containing protein [Pseudomonadota bacterium]